MDIRQQMETINACICRQTELYGEWAKRHGMSYNTVMILYALDRERARTQKEIAEGWMIPKQTVHTVVKDLERQGYVTFEAGRDQKEKNICFTPAGKALVEQHMRELYDIEERAMTAMGPDLCQALVAGNLAFTEAFAQGVRYGS